MKILIATEKPFAPVAVGQMREIIEDAGIRLSILEKYSSKAELINEIIDADAVIIRSDIIDEEVLDAAKNLKLVVRAGAGYDNIDLKAATKDGIVAMNTPGQNANAVAELVFGMLVMMARNVFDGTTGTELKNKTLGLHAYGNVSRNVARIAKGFGMKVYAYDPFLSEEQIKSEDVIPVSTLEDLYKQCQYVSLHIPATPQTIKSINYDLLSLMPKGATLINTARKEIIDEESLKKLMEERADFTYISDIKPDNASEFIDKFSGRVFFTPKKMGAQTKEANINAGLAAAHQCVDFLKKGIDKFRVN
ncbi:MAG: 3-phosphoglycerate dehydrogenase [Bacteroidales bacterium]|nr:3-phosphoglycerate dehydrogenase [Bacteroidales bacterium]